MDLQEFLTDEKFDVVVAEGFVASIPNRDDMVRKLAGLLAAGGTCIITFGDRHGALMEITKALLLYRLCEIDNIDPDSESGLEIARELFADDFSRLKASRHFDAWWTRSPIPSP